MSGRKCSNVTLQREQQEKLRLDQAVTNLQAEARAQANRLSAIRDGASDGLRATFSAEIGQVDEWLQGYRQLESGDFKMTSDLSALRQAKAQLDPFVARGRQAQEALVVALTQKADAIGKHLARQLAETEQLYLRGEALFRLWCGQQQTQAWSEAIQTAHQQVKRQEYADAEGAIAALRQELSTQGDFAAAQEEKHQKRQYLLTALRQVCTEMKFREESPPRQEREGDRASRIFYTVDTLDRGKIAFALSLDGISSFSEVADAHCFEEFDQISKFLGEEFGVQTHFESEEGKTRPVLKHNEQKRLPRGRNRSAGKE